MSEFAEPGHSKRQGATCLQRAEQGGELIKVAVSREGPVGPRAAMKPLMEVWQLKVTKT